MWCCRCGPAVRPNRCSASIRYPVSRGRSRVWPPPLDPDRPIYGLQAPTLAIAAVLPDTIEEWARIYVDAIRSVQPQGPYHLLGWSMGGVFAHEIAVQLQRAGQRVATLAVMDSYMADPPDERGPGRGLAGAGGRADRRIAR
ncbi:thioesterase domain-containing protein [Nocardia sp. NPDC004604]|uniref:thioesterase domain-containing protein n=1 Tax=Nocardia sp. NPDC004604 TaxID=3157013 RepID=UPI0033BA74DD